MTSAGPLFIIASALLVIAILCAGLSLQRKKRIAVFVAGILFIISGKITRLFFMFNILCDCNEIARKRDKKRK